MEQHPLLRSLAQETIVRFSIRHPLSLVFRGLPAMLFFLIPFLFWFDWAGWQWLIPSFCFALGGFFAWWTWTSWQHSLFLETTREYIAMIPRGLLRFERRRWEKTSARLLTEQDSFGRRRFIVTQGEPMRRWVFRGMRPWLGEESSGGERVAYVDRADILERLSGAPESLWQAVHDLLSKHRL